MHRIIAFIFLLIPVLSFSQLHRLEKFNVSTFTIRQKSDAAELKKIPEVFRLHPELGILPFVQLPDPACVELIDKRDAFSRYYVKKGSGGSHYYLQQAAAAINYQDENGWWREINHRLRPVAGKENCFEATEQPTPFHIDLANGSCTVEWKNKKFVFNKNLELLHVNAAGEIQPLGVPNFKNYSAGDEGIRIRDYYPGIDLLFTVEQGRLETSFIVKRRLILSDGYLVMKQDLLLEQDLKINAVQYGVKSSEDISIGNVEDQSMFSIAKSFAFDNSANPVRLDLEHAVHADNSFWVYTPVSWLNNPSNVYPVIIDPVVTTSAVTGAASIAGTKFGATCWTNSCDYTMAVPTPANTTITNVYASFEYFATGACFAQDGGFSISLGGCTYPSAAPGVITCAFPISNFNCGILNATMLSDLQSCLPAPQCAQQNLNFTLHFYRCNNDPGLSCGAACIRASQPWMIILEGRTVEVNYTSTYQVICERRSVLLPTTTNYGVGPYQFSWSPGGQTNDTITVSPTVNTIYTITATDACGTTSTGISQVDVTPYDNPGFSISPVTACIGQPINLNGFGSSAAADYDWLLPGSNAPGGVINNNKSPVIQYAIPGVYTITLRYSSTPPCVFDSTIAITITGAVAADVSLAAVPAGTVCQGDPVRFYASPTNGGAIPSYEWYVDGILVQAGFSDSLITSSLNNGSLVQVVLYSSSSCAAPTVDTASVFVAVSSAAVPQVDILPYTSACPGSPITFQTAVLNGGATPSYQWTIDGVPVAGANAASFTTNVAVNNTVIGVMMTSSLSCVSVPAGNDTVHVQLLAPSTPSVAISGNPSGAVCAGDPITFLAQSQAGGAAPLYQWYVNGMPMGPAAADSVFQFANPANGDSISVTLTSSLTCVTTSTADSYSITSVTPAVAPVVNLQQSPPGTVCAGTPLTITAANSGGGASPGFAWYLNGVLQSDNDSVFTSTTFSNNDQLSVVFTSSLACALVPTDTDLINISIQAAVTPGLSISPSGAVLCDGDPLQMIASPAGGGNNPTFTWTVNGLAVAGTNDTIILNVLNGDVVQATLTSSLPCANPPIASSNTFTVSAIPAVTPTVSILALPGDTICVGQSLSITTQTQHAGTNPTYQWWLNGVLQNVTTSQYSASTFQSGDQVQVQLVSNAPCVTTPVAASNVLTIATYPALSVQAFGPGAVCPGTTVNLSAFAGGGDGGPYQYQWTGSSQQSSTITVTASVSSNYQVTVRDVCGSTPATAIVALTVLPGPVADFIYSPVELSTFNNTVQFQNLSQNAISWLWQFGDSSSSTLSNPDHLYAQPGNYDVMLITQSLNGCRDTVVYRIVVKEDIAIFFPNAFSPNADFFNETWSPVGLSLGKYTFRIWNRWGEIIFEGNNDKPWDGSIAGSSKLAPEGVYVYQVLLDENKFEEPLLTGRVTLIR